MNLGESCESLGGMSDDKLGKCSLTLAQKTYVHHGINKL